MLCARVGTGSCVWRPRIGRSTFKPSGLRAGGSGRPIAGATERDGARRLVPQILEASARAGSKVLALQAGIDLLQEVLGRQHQDEVPVLAVANEACLSSDVSEAAVELKPIPARAEPDVAVRYDAAPVMGEHESRHGSGQHGEYPRASRSSMAAGIGIPAAAATSAGVDMR